MLKLLNIVEQGSKSQGWKLNISQDSDGKFSYMLKLGGYDDSNVSVKLYPDDFQTLWSNQGRQSQPSNLLHVEEDGCAVYYVKSDEDNDTNLILFNFETKPINTLTHISVTNGQILQIETSIDDMHRNRITMFIEATDPNMDVQISVSYGQLYTTISNTQTFTYPSIISSEKFQIDTVSNNRVDSPIQANSMELTVLNTSQG